MYLYLYRFISTFILIYHWLNIGTPINRDVHLVTKYKIEKVIDLDNVSLFFQ